MAKFTFKENISGFNELRNSNEVQELLLQKAKSIESSAKSKSGGSYTTDVKPGKTRAHARVKTADRRSRNMEYNHNCLLKSIDAGRQ